MAAARKSIGGAAGSRSPWLAAVPSKRWGEVFFLLYSPFWITWALVVVVPFGLFEHFNKTDYMLVGLSAALPCFVVPMLFPGKADRGKHWSKSYWAKANVWVAVYSFIGNYFWTHYFYKLLGARYTFPSWDLNEVPICLYLMTHAYFIFYHAVGNVCLRRVRAATARWGSKWARKAAFAGAVFVLSYITAIGETVTISAFPYYDFEDRSKMLSVGSLFYAIYFFVSFPMFLRMDENPKDQWTLGRAALDALAAGMLCTIILDLWRVFLGPIAGVTGGAAAGRARGSMGLPWFDSNRWGR